MLILFSGKSRVSCSFLHALNPRHAGRIWLILSPWVRFGNRLKINPFALT
jgi:hypothetical protein